MADANIEITYRSKVAILITWICVLTSPSWLIMPALITTYIIVAAMVALFCQPAQSILLMINQLMSEPLKLVGVIAAGLSYTGVFATVSLLASDRRLVANDTGLRLPMFLALLNRFNNNIPWSKVQSITVVGNIDDAYEKLKLQIYTTDDKEYVLKLGAMAPQDAEKLLLAAEMWLPPKARNPMLESLQQKFALLALPGRERSHRQMLDDELDSRFTAAAFRPLEPEEVLDTGRLVVIRQIAFGGLSAVYLVQEDKHSLYVLKESIIPSQSKDELKQKAYELFRREIDLLKRLDHENIVKVIRAFRENEREYLLLQYIAGETFRQMVRENGPRPQSEVLTWAKSLVDTLAYLHGMDPPILHRDLTPENIIVAASNVPIIIDFGVADELIANATATLVGKHCYISPEQFRGRALPQSDIYSLGGTLYYLLTGNEPVPLSQSIPRAIDTQISASLSEVVADMTDLALSTRIAPTAELIERLEMCF